jgi:hypothetical protein
MLMRFAGNLDVFAGEPQSRPRAGGTRRRHFYDARDEINETYMRIQCLVSVARLQ